MVAVSTGASANPAARVPGRRWSSADVESRHSLRERQGCTRKQSAPAEVASGRSGRLFGSRMVQRTNRHIPVPQVMAPCCAAVRKKPIPSGLRPHTLPGPGHAAGSSSAHPRGTGSSFPRYDDSGPPPLLLPLHFLFHSLSNSHAFARRRTAFRSRAALLGASLPPKGNSARGWTSRTLALAVTRSSAFPGCG
jgi:hypothetical protein